MKKKILATILCFLLAVGSLPLSAFAWGEGISAHSRLDDSASYLMNVYDDPLKLVSGQEQFDQNTTCHWADNSITRTPTIKEYAHNQAIFLKEFDGETFMELDVNEKVGAGADSTVRFYHNAFYGKQYKNMMGLPSSVDTSALTHMAFRVKISGGKSGQLSAFSFNYIFDTKRETELSNAFLVDFDSGKVVDPGWSGPNFKFTDEFNGWIVVPFEAWPSNTVDGVKYTAKEIILGTVKNAVDGSTGTDDFQIRLHRGCSNHGANSSSWDDRVLYFGDIMVLSDANKFASARIEKHKNPCSFVKTIVRPTDTEKGYTVHTCSVCGDSYTDSYVDPIGLVDDRLELSMYHMPQFCTYYTSGGQNTNEDRIREFRDVLNAGYVNTVMLPHNDVLFEQFVEICQEYNIMFWIAPGLYRSNLMTLESYYARTEVVVNIVKKHNAWNLCKGFEWDEPLINGLTNEEFYAMTKLLSEKYGKGIRTVFAVASIIPNYYGSAERTTELLQSWACEYITDAGWDWYSLDVRESALTNQRQINYIKQKNAAWGANAANADELYRWYHQQMLNIIGHDTNIYFFPTASKQGLATGEGVDEDFARAHLEYFIRLLDEQKYKGGITCYGYMTFSDRTALHQYLPVLNENGEQELYPTVPKWKNYAKDLKALNVSFTRKCEFYGHSYDAVVTPPTCTSEGYTTYTCKVCGESYVDNETGKTSHVYSSKVVKPTCTEQGYTVMTCKACGKTNTTRYTAPLGHSYEKKITPPTATEEGFTTYTCTNCGDSFVDDFVPSTGNTNTTVQNMQITATDTSITVTWNEIAGATKYNLYVNDAEGKNLITRALAADKTSVTLSWPSELEWDKTYSIGIRARTTKWLDTVYKTAALTVADRIVDVKTQSVGRTIKVDWRAYEGATQYYVYVYEKGAYPTAFTSVKATTNSATIINAINPEVDYEVRVIATKGVAKMATADALSIDARLNVFTPDTFTERGITPTKVGVGFDEVRGADKYWVYLIPVGGGEEIIKESTRAIAAVGSLAPNTEYTVQIQARIVDADGKAHYSGKSAVLGTIKTSNWEDIGFAATATNSGAALTWNAPTNAYGYIIYRSVDGGKTYKRLATISDAAQISYTDTAAKNGYMYGIIYQVQDDFVTAKGSLIKAQ